MPAKSKNQRVAAAIALNNPSKLYKRNKGMKDMSKEDLEDFAKKPKGKAKKKG